jgi:hypothetical protein
MYRRKVQKNMFWYVAHAFAISNFFVILAMCFAKGVGRNCLEPDFEPPHTDLRVYTTFLIFFSACGGILFNTGLWYLVIKYWEVSITVPIQVKGEQVTPKLRKQLN